MLHYKVKIRDITFANQIDGFDIKGWVAGEKAVGKAWGPEWISSTHGAARSGLVRL